MLVKEFNSWFSHSNGFRVKEELVTIKNRHTFCIITGFWYQTWVNSCNLALRIWNYISLIFSQVSEWTIKRTCCNLLDSRESRIVLVMQIVSVMQKQSFSFLLLQTYPCFYRQNILLIRHNQRISIILEKIFNHSHCVIT